MAEFFNKYFEAKAVNPLQGSAELMQVAQRGLELGGNKRTIIDPAFMLANFLNSREFPDYLLTSDLQRSVFSENLPTITAMLPDMVVSNVALREAGYHYTRSPLHDRDSEDGLRTKALAFGNVIRKTYPDGAGGTNYPLKLKDPNQIIADVLAQTLDLYSVHNSDGDMSAVFATVHRGDILGGYPHAVELGRTGIRADHIKDMPSARGVSKLRLYHLLTDPRFFARENNNPITYIYADIRLGEQWTPHYPGGKGVQSVFFGGKEHGENLGFGIGTVGWRYRLGRPEPFAFIFRPLLPETYKRELAARQVFVPDPEDAAMMTVQLRESFGTVPTILSDPQWNERELIDPRTINVVTDYNPKSTVAADVFAKINIVDTDQEVYDMVKGNVQVHSLAEAISMAELGNAPFIEVYLELNASEAMNPERMAATVKTLKEMGFTYNGWLPSNARNNASLMISFARINGHGNLIRPDMPEKYYKNGHEGSRNVALQIFQNLADRRK